MYKEASFNVSTVVNLHVSYCMCNATPTCHIHQEIVPDELMEIYLSIMEQGRAQSADGELQYQCAFSLPAVVRTLGRTHWKIVKPIFDLLAVDQNVSCSLHSIPLFTNLHALNWSILVISLVHISNLTGPY